MNDLIASLTIDNIMLSEIGPVLEALREAGFQVEINISRPPERAKKDER